jgi:hypothetical protein
VACEVKRRGRMKSLFVIPAEKANEKGCGGNLMTLAERTWWVEVGCGLRLRVLREGTRRSANANLNLRSVREAASQDPCGAPATLSSLPSTYHNIPDYAAPLIPVQLPSIHPFPSLS